MRTLTTTTAHLSHPRDEIESRLQEFDATELDAERTLEKLFRLYPSNTIFEDVLPKVLVLNHQYSTGILATAHVARHIVSKQIDPLLRQGNPDVVGQIAVVQLRVKPRNNYSFATKYCAWHNPCAYPIYDSFVERMLWTYRKQDGFCSFQKQDLWEYGRFRQIVESFRTYYGLTAYTLKEIDKFLCAPGQVHFPRDDKAGPATEDKPR